MKRITFHNPIKKIMICSVLILSLIMTVIPVTPTRAATSIQLYDYNVKKQINYTNKQLKVTYSGSKISNDLYPSLIMNGTELAPYNDIFEKSKIGAACTFDEAKGTVTISKNSNIILLKLGSKEATINGNKAKLPAAPIKIKYIKSKTIKIMVPVKFVAEALGYGYSYLSSKNEIAISSYRYGNLPGNYAHESRYLYQDGWLYTNVADTFLMKMKSDGSQEKTIMGIYKAKNLNYKDGYIYYIKEGGIYRNTLTGEKQVVINKSQNIISFIIYDKYIYYISYSDNRKIYRMNLDGSGRTRLVNDINCTDLYINKAHIFYSQDKGMYRINRDGSGRTKLHSNRVTNILSDSTYLYFVNNADSNIYKANLDGSNITEICSDKAQNLNIFGDILYYQNLDDNHKLYAITTSGKRKLKIVDEIANNPTVINDRLYYQPDKAREEIIYSVKLKPLVEENNSADTTGNFNGNLINNAFTAFSDFNIYFSDPFLYRASSDYSDNREWKRYKYSDDGIFNGINIAGNYIYCTKFKNNKNVDINSGGIYKIKKDGSQAPTLLTNLNAGYLTVVGDWIYFTVYSWGSIFEGSGTIYKMRTDGSELQIILDQSEGLGRCLNIDGNYIYFINEKDQNRIYRMNLDGGDRTRLSNEENINLIQVYGDDIYYKQYGKGFLRMPKDGGEGTSILPNSGDKIMVYNEKIYYLRFNVSEGYYSISSCNLDGTEVTRIKNDVYSGMMNITAGYLFYMDKQTYKIQRIKL